MCEFSIRPHHLLCLQFFEGKGYSNDFVRHMTGIHEKLLNENPKINLVEGVDDICKGCPHNIEGQCDKELSVSGNDRRTHEVIKEEVEQGQTWSELTNVVYKNIIHEGRLEQVCGTCRWSDICMKKVGNS